MADGRSTSGSGGATGPARWVAPPPGYAAPEPGADTPRAGPENRRNARKTMARKAVATEVLPGGAIGVSWPCRTLDLSRGGLGLISRRLLPPGASILLRIEGSSGRLGDPIYCAVMHVDYLVEGEHRLGVEFRPTPAGQAVQEWVRANRAAA